MQDAHSVQLDRAERAMAGLYPLRMLSYGVAALWLTILIATPVIVVLLVRQQAYPALFTFLYGTFGVGVPIGLLSYFTLGSAVIHINRAACFLVGILFLAYLPIQIFLFAREVLRHPDPASMLVSVVPYSLLSGLTVSLALALLRLARLTMHERALLRAPFDGLVNKAAFQFAYGFPPIVNFVRGIKARFVIFLSSVCFAAAISNLTDVAGDARFATVGEQLMHLAMDLMATVVLIVAANWLLRWGQRNIRFSVAEITAADSRAPVLFLRAFRDDQVALPKPQFTCLGRLLSIAATHDESLDRILLTEGTLFGPVVALGNPRDKIPPYGAARGFVANELWQETITQLARSALAVVIAVDDTDSIWWEIEHLVGHDHVGKTLFLVPPKFRGLAENRHITGRIAAALSLPADFQAKIGDALRTADVIGFFLDKGGNLCVGRSRWFSSFSYLLMTRWFLRHKFGFGLSLLTPRGELIQAAEVRPGR